MTQEFGKCSFCGEDKPLTRKYMHAKNKEHIDTNKHTPFIIVKYCDVCGITYDDTSETVYR